MDGGYAWEKLHVAVLSLAAGSGTLRDRVKDAYGSSLIRLRPNHHFPWPDIRDRFIMLMDEIAPHVSSDAAFRSWPDHDLRQIADEIVTIYDKVIRHQAG